MSAGTGSQTRVLEEPSRGRIDLRVEYERTVPTRSRREPRVRGVRTRRSTASTGSTTERTS